MDILCARFLSLVTSDLPGGDRRMVCCVVASRTGWVAIACRAEVAGSGRVTRDRRLAGLGFGGSRTGAGG
jgi:hypothetical protein